MVGRAGLGFPGAVGVAPSASCAARLARCVTPLRDGANRRKEAGRRGLWAGVPLADDPPVASFRAARTRREGETGRARGEDLGVVSVCIAL